MDELTDFQRQHLKQLKEEEKEELAKGAGIVSSFKKWFCRKGILLNDENFRFYRTIGIVATYPNIIQYLHSSLIADKEELYNFKNLCNDFKRHRFNNGYLLGDNFMLMAHPYFRRGFHEASNYAPRFIDLFWNYSDSNADTYISLDPSRVRINIDSSAYRELDTWYGSRFEGKIEMVPDGIVKLRPPMDIDDLYISFFFSDTYSLDIKWLTKERIKTFQAEEFKTEKIKILKDGLTYYPARYIHAEYDLDKQHFRHFDGAIHFYTESEYYSRRDSDFNYNSKNKSHIKTLSQKLFKMNGKIDINTWIEFSSHFFTGNPLTFEYFEGKYPPHIIEMLEKIRNRKNEEPNSV